MRFLHRFSARSAPQFPACGTGTFSPGRIEIIIVRSSTVRNAASIQAPATTSMFELHGSIATPCSPGQGALLRRRHGHFAVLMLRERATKEDAPMSHAKHAPKDGLTKLQRYRRTQA